VDVVPVVQEGSAGGAVPETADDVQDLWMTVGLDGPQGAGGIAVDLGLDLKHGRVSGQKPWIAQMKGKGTVSSQCGDESLEFHSGSRINHVIALASSARR
jgi:hypothetical protein